MPRNRIARIFRQAVARIVRVVREAPARVEAWRARQDGGPTDRTGLSRTRNGG